MIQGAFQHRSGRMIAIGRTVIATFFLIAIWLDHTQPSLAAPETYAVLAAYVLLSLGVLACSWNSWWLESRLAVPTHIADLLIFLWLNYATQGYASPFVTFFVFLILSASIRWGWRGTAATAIIIVPLYVASALTAASWGTEAFEWRRFAIRSSYLVALSSMIIFWLLTQRPADGGEAAPPIERTRDGLAATVAAVMEGAATRFGAPRALFVWNDGEEPWTYVARLEGGAFGVTKHDPGQYDPPTSALAGEGPFLFDHRRRRILTRRQGRRRSLRSLRDPVHPGLAADYGAGLAFRLEGVKKGAAAGRDIAGEVDELQRDLAEEQLDLRHFIAQLRGNVEGDARNHGELTASLRELNERVAAQWGVACRVVTDPGEISVTSALEQNVRQLVRDAIANAVRHGGGTEIQTRLACDIGRLAVEISDNGSGFPLQGEFGEEELREHRIGPSSLRERIAIMGGTLRLASRTTGSTLSITLPLQDAR